jgi:hypothetical protein
MSRDPIRVRLCRGANLPIPPDESVDGDVVLNPEMEIRVRDSSWARRRIARGDLEIVPPARSMTMDSAAPLELEPTPQHEPENIVQAVPLLDFDDARTPRTEKHAPIDLDLKTEDGR